MLPVIPTDVSNICSSCRYQNASSTINKHAEFNKGKKPQAMTDGDSSTLQKTIV
jgi:hypothetical protein